MLSIIGWIWAAVFFAGVLAGWLWRRRQKQADRRGFEVVGSNEKQQ